MPVVLIDTLNPSQKASIQSMDEGFPINDADFFILYESDGFIPSAAAFIQEDDESYECYAFTAPAFRCRGLFTMLLETAIEYLPEDTQFLFYTDGKDSDCMAAIHALEAELFMEEHMMEINLSDIEIPDSRKDFHNAAQSVQTYDLDGTKTVQYDSPVGTVRISVFSSHYYLYGFEIVEELRGKGYGKTFLQEVLYDLASQKAMPLRLQVSGDNIPAFSLYKKTGFQITETLFGYLY